MKTLKLEDENLHMRFKIACTEAKVSMLEATHQMVLAWVQDVEKQRYDLRLTEQPKAKGATRQSRKPNRHQGSDASEKVESPSA